MSDVSAVSGSPVSSSSTPETGSSSAFDSPSTPATHPATTTASPAATAPAAEGTSSDLADAQANRDPESVGPTPALGSVRRVTSDELDPHRDWTVQSGRPYPQDVARTTRFNPLELPDPQKAVDAGLIPVMLPPGLIDANHITQPPSDNPALDHPFREANADADPGYAASTATSVNVGLEAAQAQRELTGSPEDRDGSSEGRSEGRSEDRSGTDTYQPAKA